MRDPGHHQMFADANEFAGNQTTATSSASLRRKS